MGAAPLLDSFGIWWLLVPPLARKIANSERNTLGGHGMNRA